jgi:hypothetical protein
LLDVSQFVKLGGGVNDPLKMQLTKEQIQSNEYLHQDFICAWDNLIPDDFCDWLVHYIDNSGYLSPRRITYLTDKQVEMHNFSPGEADFLQGIVNQCATEYMDKYPYLQSNSYSSSCVLLQKTEPKEGFHAFHCEDSAWNTQTRTLAWMVYLNDVEDGGETEFLYQQLKIKPVKGRIVIWPGSFTHLHRGNPPMSNKYIATGWYAGAQGLEKRFFSPNDSSS